MADKELVAPPAAITEAALSRYRNRERISFAVAAIGFFLFWFIAYWASSDEQTLEESVPVAATVKHYAPSMKYHPESTISVAYAYEGEDHYVKGVTAGAAYDVGDQITIYVDPEDPTRVRTEDVADAGGWPIAAGLALGAVLVGLVMGIQGFRGGRALRSVLTQAPWRTAVVDNTRVSFWTQKTRMRCTPSDGSGAFDFFVRGGTLPDDLRPLYGEPRTLHLAGPVGRDLALCSADGTKLGVGRL